ncbi:MAG: diacylglycerol kinase family protein [Nanoarchaeota archaeon]
MRHFQEGTRVHLFANPLSGHGATRKCLPSIINALAGRGMKVTTHLFSCPEDLEQVGSDAVDADLWLVAGGDGSTEAVASRLASLDDQIPLGLLPTGSVNNTVQAFSLPSDWRQALKALLQGKPAPVDLIDVGGKTCLSCASFGFDAAACHYLETHHGVKNLSDGRERMAVFLYFMVGIKTFITYAPSRMRVVSADPEKRRSGYWVLLGNFPHYPGPWKLFPHADPHDGLFDILVCHRSGFLDTLRYVVVSKHGHHIRQSDITYFQAKELVIRAEGGGKVPFQIAGHQVGNLADSSLRIKVKPKALRIMVPEHYPSPLSGEPSHGPSST